MPFKLKNGVIYDQDCQHPGTWAHRGEYELIENGKILLKINPSLSNRADKNRIQIEADVAFWGLYISQEDCDKYDYKERLIFRRILI